ncbi:class I SAM-dependent methyltransferase [Methanofervidicoccus abyssi]|uniref:SAM-dependent methyltransferase n=1 Tax=Methanofervidicoccus abyssi TaxID=2082189 RepID=A0A401HNI9_9EURY|nr:class I SAM-dependent methyltransferase [Methanofervidicoccus abyssi]GBF35824.1 SAM-dependent methyltransferase [Methanofervidicoccus abyssi]
MRRVIEYYNTLAKEYDNIYKDIKYMRSVEFKVLKSEIKKDYLILDVGCGTGEHLMYLRDYNIIGLDISIEMLKRAKDKSGKFVVVGDIQHLPFKSRSFNCVISFFGALNHVQINRALKEIRRILVKEGLFIFTLANLYHMRWIFKSLLRKGWWYTVKAIKKRKGDITKVVDGKKIRVNTRFYSLEEVEDLLEKHNFHIKYTFGTYITNSPLDNILYKTFLKHFGGYIGAVAVKK